MIVGLDANVLIYFLDDASPFFLAASQLLEHLESSGGAVIMSAIGRTEILNVPYRVSATQGALVASLLDDFEFISYVPTSKGIADRAAELIGQQGNKLKNMDAVHLATALAESANVFYTNDHTLLSLKKVGALKIVPLT